jgi:hypothetical protein
MPTVGEYHDALIVWAPLTDRIVARKRRYDTDTLIRLNHDFLPDRGLTRCRWSTCGAGA